MNINKYQDSAMYFRKETADEIYAVLGLSGEVGELHSMIAKAIRDETELDKEHVVKELGDILWFIAAIASDIDVTLEEVAQTNIDKLNGRLKRGTIEGSGDDR